MVAIICFVEQIGWHQDEGHLKLQENFLSLLKEHYNGSAPEDLTVFVPLCGKSQDLLYFYNLGYLVVGVEYSQIAINEFFTENNIKLASNSPQPYTKSEDGRLILCQGDLFTFSGDPSSPLPLPVETFDIVWDRGSFEAIHINDRERYIKLLSSLANPKTLYLLAMKDYDKTVYPGPPVAATPEEVKGLFGHVFSVSAFCSYDLFAFDEDFKERFSAKGLKEVIENLYMLKSV